MTSIAASLVQVHTKREHKRTIEKKSARAQCSSRSHNRGTSTRAGFSTGESIRCANLAANNNRTGRRTGVVTMAAKVAAYIKLAIEAGKANPAPPIGPALGSKVRSFSFDTFYDSTRTRA